MMFIAIIVHCNYCSCRVVSFVKKQWQCGKLPNNRPSNQDKMAVGYRIASPSLSNTVTDVPNVNFREIQKVTE